MVALLTALALVMAPPLSSGAKAHVTLASFAPPTAAGIGFRPAERVVATLQVRGKTFRVNVVARANGQFTARFSPLIAIEPCSGSIVLLARGNRGSTAKAVRECRPADPAP